MPQCKIIYIAKMVNLKFISLLLFFELGYLTWYKTYTYQIFNMYRKHSDQGKGVSDFFIQVLVLILEKKTGNFCHFFIFFFKSPTSTCYNILTKTYINILRHPALQMGLRNMYSHSQACKSHIKRDILVQKIYMENEHFPILSIFQ